MFKFLTRLFAIIGFVFVLVIVVGSFVVIHTQGKPEPEPDSVVLVIDFNQPIVERSEPSPIDLAIHEEEMPLLEVLQAIKLAKDDPHVKGIVGRFGSAQPSLGQAQELDAALKAFRAKGKFTYAFGTDYGEFGMGNRTYVLATAFENIWLQPVGTVALTGLEIQSPFGKTALDKIGVTADFMKREEYKSFMDMATRDDFAPPVRANMQDLLNDLADQEAQAIAQNRGMDAAHVKDLMANGPYTDDEALKAGLVTKVAYADQLDKELQQKAGPDVKDLDVDNYLAVATPPKAPVKARIAFIHGVGLITDRDSGGPDGVLNEEVMGADTIAAAFEDAAEDKNIKAILFRIDSPGGSPSASETIRRSMIHAEEKGKPVYVSMGDTAASGGYWIAMSADHIVAEPGTLTGSIGVLAGKFDIAGLLQKLGLSIGSVKTADNAGLWSPAEGFTPAQRDRINALLDNTYHAFTQDVANARKISPAKMPDLAKGRVWTGAQAQKLGLVDELGGYQETVDALRKQLQLKESDKVELLPFPPPETPAERVMKLLKTLGVEGAMVRSTLVEWQTMSASFRPLFDAAQQPVAARMPMDMERAIK